MKNRNDRSKKQGKPAERYERYERRPVLKAIPADGIWLERRGNQTNWTAFRTQFLNWIFSKYDDLSTELEANEDLDEEIEEPPGDPESFAYKFEIKRLEHVLKKRAKREDDRLKVFGEIFLHICLESENLVLEHEDYAAAAEHNSPRLLWRIVRTTSITPQHGGQMAVWLQRARLNNMRQRAGQSIEEYSRAFKLEYEKLLAVDGELDHAVAAQTYMISLNGHGEEFTHPRWMTGLKRTESLTRLIRRSRSL